MGKLKSVLSIIIIFPGHCIYDKTKSFSSNFYMNELPVHAGVAYRNFTLSKGKAYFKSSN